MAYPRRCEGCGASYTSWAGQINFPHLTLASQDGGTASPWAPEKPGRILDIGCRLCGSIFRWDYFAPGEGRLGRAISLLRGPLPNWRAGDAFTSELRTARGTLAHRRAS